jgi:hypothetical protein
LCRRQAAVDCRRLQGAGCAAPYIENCDGAFGVVPPPLDAAPPPQVYAYTQLYRQYPGWTQAGPPPADFPYTDVPIVVTTTAVPPWWTPYGASNVYQYAGYPAAPTFVPAPPPPPPPPDMPLTVSYPDVLPFSAAITYDGNNVYQTEGAVTVLVTRVTSLAPTPLGPVGVYGSIEQLVQPESVFAPAPTPAPDGAPIPGPDNGAYQPAVGAPGSPVPTGYPAQSDQGQYSPQQPYPGQNQGQGQYPPQPYPAQPQQPQQPAYSDEEQAPGQQQPYPSQQQPYQPQQQPYQPQPDQGQSPPQQQPYQGQPAQGQAPWGNPAGQSYPQPSAPEPLPLAPPATVPNPVAPIPEATTPAPVPPPGTALVSTVEKHTLTIPDEVIAVPGGQTIRIPGSTVTVTGPWPPPGAGGYTPTPAKWTGLPGVTPSAASGASASITAPLRRASGWTPVNPEAPYTPGPEPVAASTAFFEPAKGNNPGVPIFEAPSKCGPNSPRCDDAQYCDPQPLCDAGTTCPGVCLPLYGGKFSQPENVRNSIWDKVMSEGIYKIKVQVTKVMQLPEGMTTMLRMVRRANIS